MVHGPWVEHRETTGDDAICVTCRRCRYISVLNRSCPFCRLLIDWNLSMWFILSIHDCDEERAGRYESEGRGRGRSSGGRNNGVDTRSSTRKWSTRKLRLFFDIDRTRMLVLRREKGTRDIYSVYLHLFPICSFREQGRE